MVLASMLGSAATSVLVQPSAMLVAGNTFVVLMRFMLSNKMTEQLLIGRCVRVSMATGLHNVTNTTTRLVVFFVSAIGMCHCRPLCEI
jgi:hypothetical protein